MQHEIKNALLKIDRFVSHPADMVIDWIDSAWDRDGFAAVFVMPAMPFMYLMIIAELDNDDCFTAPLKYAVLALGIISIAAFCIIYIIPLVIAIM